MVFLPELPDYDNVIDTLIDSGYEEEFCISDSFEVPVIRSLMQAGFLVMSFQNGEALLLPKLHLERSVLFFKNLHIPKSLKSRLHTYTLKPFDSLQPIIKACVEAHGDEWMTQPLCNVLSELEWNPKVAATDVSRYSTSSQAFCTAFGLYKNNKLVAGEFGVFYGGVYTSYSGFYWENNAGTIQMILTARLLEKSGFAFWDLGMPMDYKSRLGAVSLARPHFIKLFREARLVRPLFSV